MNLIVKQDNVIIFQEAIIRYSLMENRLSAMITNGYHDIVLQNNKLYSVIIEDETNGSFTKYGEYLSYNFLVMTAYDTDPQTNEFLLDGDGARIVKNSVGDNTLLFKVF
jgi:hypothetical protein